MYISVNNRRFMASGFFAGAMSTAFASYLVTAFIYVGFSPSEIATLMTLYTMGTIISLPLIGYIIDNVLPVKKMLLIMAGITIVTTVAIKFLPIQFGIVAIGILLLSMFQKPTLTIMEVYVLKTSKIRSDVDAEVPRAGNSSGYAISSLVTGLCVTYLGVMSLFYIQVALTTIFLITVLRLVNIPTSKEIASQIKEIQTKEKVNVLKNIGMLVKNGKYMTLILAASCVYSGLALYNTYLPIYIDFVGGDTSILGLVLFIMALSEVPTFLMYNKINKRFSVETLYVTGILFFTLKILIIAAIPNVVVIILSQLLQLGSFTLLMPNLNRRIYDVVPQEISLFAITVGSTFYTGLVSAFVIYIGGFFIEEYGVHTVMYISSGFMATGLIVGIMDVMYTKRNKLKVS